MEEAWNDAGKDFHGPRLVSGRAKLTRFCGSFLPSQSTTCIPPILRQDVRNPPSSGRRTSLTSPWADSSHMMQHLEDEPFDELNATFNLDLSIPAFDHDLGLDLHAVSGGREILPYTLDGNENLDRSTLADALSRRRDGSRFDPVLTEASSQPWQPTSSNDRMMQPFQPAIDDRPDALSSLDAGDYQSTQFLSDLPDSDVNDSRPLQNPDQTTPPKIGKRFSSESIKVLKTWLWDHIQRPYPRSKDIEIIEKQTGLSRQQITNWFANARRRTKFRRHQLLTLNPPSTSSPSLPGPRRCDSPAPFEDMNPLQRWQNSPPESEPASVSAIARAVSGFSADQTSLQISHWNDDGLGASLFNASSASSAGTSHSSRSTLSFALSDTSRASNRSFDRIKKPIKRRRRRVPARRPKGNGMSSLSQSCYMFQCTFCTETFKTKHNWERHENSLHLSLEQWECSPCGPTIANAKSELVCVYCGEVNPSQDHLMGHNYATCQARLLEDRTFYRKDHLQQHLKLVHDAEFMRWPMARWKREIKQIRSRCGFCDLTLNTWGDRVSHLAEHFKAGKTIADWKGDWGFEAPVLDMVESAIPPYLIHHERSTPVPFTAKQWPQESPISAFELIELELEYFIFNHPSASSEMPSHQELQYEACCIIFGADMVSQDRAKPEPSWLRDLLMSSEHITKKARIRPVKIAVESRITQLKIRGKDDIFEGCKMEAQLHKYVDTLRLLNLDVGDGDLQQEAYSIVRSMEAASRNPSERFVHLLTSLIYGSTHWLAPFRQRADLALVESAPAHILGNPNNDLALPNDQFPATEMTAMTSANIWAMDAVPSASSSKNSRKVETAMPFFLNHDNCYKRLSRELSRFVASTMSTRNPNSHVPTDEELQHQARWIIYDDGDPWNQTPADHADWLRDFKRDVGLL